MKISKWHLVLILTLLTYDYSYGQKPITIGKEFYIGSFTNFPSNTKISIYAYENSTIKISNPSNSLNQTYLLSKDSSLMVILDTSKINGQFNYGVHRKTIRVVSTGLISIKVGQTLGGSGNTIYELTSILPVENLSGNYRLITPKVNAWYDGDYHSIVSTRDSTIIEITPTDSIFDGSYKKSKYNIILNRGECYYFHSANNSSGTTIRCLNPCDKIIILEYLYNNNLFYKGSTLFPPDNNSLEVLSPDKYSGKKFLVSPKFVTESNGDYWEIVKYISGTKGSIYINGKFRALKANVADTFHIKFPSIIISSEPINMVQYTPGANFYNITSSTGNLKMSSTSCLVSPFEQRIKAVDVLFYDWRDNKWLYSNLNLIYKKHERTLIRVNGIRLDSVQNPVFMTFYNDTTYELFTFNKNYPINGKIVKIISSGNGFVINVFQCQEGYRLCSYNPGFNTEKLDIEMRINNSSHLDWGKDSIPRFCNGNIKFECFTNYKVDSWKWIIEDSNYNKNGFFHKFKDTGKHRVIMIANRISPVITCNGTYVLSDTIIRDIWVYSSPIIEIFEDTIVACIGEKIILKNIRKGDNKPQWLFDIGNLSCTYCGEPEFIAQENSPKLQTIGVMISKNGCLPARDTVTIIRKEPLRLRISGDSLICYGEEILLTAKASGGDSSGYKILWPEYGLRDSVITKLYESKKILAILEDGCSYNNGQLYRDTVEFKVMVSNRFKLIEINDTSVCKSSDLNVLLKTTGGNNSAYKTFWLNGIVLPDSLLKINSNISQKYQIIAGESCSPVRDTSYFTVNIKPDPNVTLISDTFVCKTSSHILKFKVQGDTIQKFNLLHNFNTLVLNDSNKSEYNFIWKIGNKNERFLALLSNKCSNTFDSLNVNLLIKNQLKFNTEVVYDTICKSSDTIKLKLIYNNLQLHQFKLYDSQHVNLIDSNSTGLFVISCKEGNNHFIATVDDGCNVGDTIKITLVNLKPLKTVFNYTPSCFIDTLHLKVALSDGNIKRYKVGWYNMSNYQIGNENIYKYAGKNSIDTIILRVEDGCSPSFSEIIPIKPMTKSKISVNSISQCLISNQFDFGNNSSKVKGTETNYYWNYDTNLNVTIKNTNLLRGSYTGTGLHNVKLIAVTDSFCNDTSNINVNIIANPNLSIKWIRTTNTEDSSIFRFNAISDQPLTSYRWEIDKFPAQFEDTIFQKFNYRGNVRVKVFGTNSYGCIGDTFIEFEVMHRMHFYLPNIITPNGDGINDAFYFPGKEYVKEYSISIFNRWGEKLFYSTNPNELFSPDDKSNNLYIYLINVLDIYNERQLINGSFSVIQ